MAAIPEQVRGLFDQKAGLRPFKVALQVNPYPYVIDQDQLDEWHSAEAFNDAMADAADKADIGLVAITDHHRPDAAGLDTALRQRGIAVLPGVEITATDNIHILGVFPEATSWSTIDAVVARCQRDQEGNGSGVPVYQVINEIVDASGIPIAAHVLLEKTGMLREMRGQARVNAWTNGKLVAAGLDRALPVGKVTPPDLRKILQNRDAQHRRDRPLALINAADVTKPEHFAKTVSSTVMRMEEATFRGLHLALTDPNSRVNRPESIDALNVCVDFPWIVGVVWAGGQPAGIALPLHQGLNVLVGGRGSGKSTVIESIRYAVGREPEPDRLRQTHTRLVETVLGSSAIVYLAIKRGEECLIVSREGSSAPRVTNQAGDDLGVRVESVLPNLRILGQHEISEIAHNDEARRALLDPLLDVDHEEDRSLRTALFKSRDRVLQARRDLLLLDGQAEELATLTAELNRLREQGVEQHIARVTAEDRLIARVDELASWAQSLDSLGGDFIDVLKDGPQAILSDARLDQLQAPPAVRELRATLMAHVEGVRKAVGRIDKTLEAIGAEIRRGRQERVAARNQAEQQANALLRLEDTGHQQAAQEFRRKVKRRQQLEDVPRRQAATQRLLVETTAERQRLLKELESFSAVRGEDHARAAKKLTRRARQAAERSGVKGQVRARHGRVTDAGTFTSLLDDVLTGHRSKLLRAIRDRETREINAIRQDEHFTPMDGRALIQQCEAGPEAVRHALPGTTAAQAEAICAAVRDQPSLALQLEEVESRDQVELQLEIDGEWRDLTQVSVGQQATAVLLALLAHEEGPLVLDQPEDDLDNEFIVSSIVPLLRAAKAKQQYILSSHNANIPVLGDADLVTVMEAFRGAGGEPRIGVRTQGAIDNKSAQERIETLLEGGRQAFDERGRRYGAK